MRNVVLALIRVYQVYLSFDTGLLRFLVQGRKVCRFSPTCSQYAYEAIEYYGILKGARLGILRILKCHPYSTGGLDPLRKSHL